METIKFVPGVCVEFVTFAPVADGAKKQGKPKQNRVTVTCSNEDWPALRDQLQTGVQVPGDARIYTYEADERRLARHEGAVFYGTHLEGNSDLECIAKPGLHPVRQA